MKAPATRSLLGVSVVALGDLRSLDVGQKLPAMGNPFGLHNTLTVGVISALDRSVPGTAVIGEDVA